MSVPPGGAGAASRVLDLGCGMSRLLADLRADGHTGELVGIDFVGIAIGRGAMMEAPFRRKNVKGGGHNVLLAGGERHYHQSGAALDTLQEFDPARGVFFCHPSLPYPVFGGVAGFHEGKLHVVGGAEWWFVSGTRRVQVFDVESAPLPTPCVYQYSPLNMSVFSRSAHPEHPTPFDQMEY